MAFDWTGLDEVQPPPVTTPPDFDWSGLDDAASTEPPPVQSFDWSGLDAHEPPTEEKNPLSEVAGNIIDAGGKGIRSIGGAFGAVGKMFSPSGQQELLNDPETAGMAGAILGPLGVVGAGDSPIAESEKENRAKAAREGINYTPQGPVDPLFAEKVGGSIGRIMATGGYAPLVEGAAKLADITQHEPDQDVNSLGSVGRVVGAAATTYLPIKAGGILQGQVARLGLGKLGSLAANATGDAAIGFGAGKSMEAIDRAGSGRGFEDYTLVPSKTDLVMSAPGAIAAGLGGLRNRAVNKWAEDIAEQTTGKGVSNGSGEREVQGQTPGRPGISPLRRQSQEVAATPTTAGEGVINQRGEQVQMPGSALDADFKNVEDAIAFDSKKSNARSLPDTIDRIRTEVFDKFRPIQKAEQSAKRLGLKVSPTASPYIGFRGLNRRIVSTVNKAMTEGLPDFATGKPATPSMQDVLTPIGGKTKEFNMLLAARRAPEMANRQDALPFDEGSAARVTQALSSDPAMQQSLKNYDALMDGGLKYVVDSGFMSSADIQAIKSKNALYSPWERVDDDGNIRMQVSPAPGKRPDQPGSPIKRVTEHGSTKQIVNPLETSIKNLVQIVSAAEKNAVKLKLVNVTDQSPELAAFATPITSDAAAKLNPSEVMTVRRDGSAENYRVHPEIRKTLDGLTADEAGWVDKSMQAVANFFRGSVTLDLPFAGNNVIRDGIQQAVISRTGHGVPLENQARGIGLLATKKGRDTWREWNKSAANQAIEYGAIMDRSALIKDMDRQAHATPGVQFVKDAIDPRNWTRLLGKAMQTFESVGRVGEYDRAKNLLLKAGVPEADAKAQAEFESVDLGDFGMSGRSKKVQAMRKWIPFFGSSLSFGYREAGALKDPKTWLKGLTTLSTMEAFNFYLNHDNPDYWNLPEDQRRRYWHIPTQGGKFVALPKPPGIMGFLFTAPVKLAADRFIAGDKEAGMEDLAKGLFENAMPPEAPQSLKTAVELGIGDSGYSFFYDRPIVNRELQGLPKEMQYTERTSLTSRGISKGLGKLGIGASPQKIDYAISSGMGPGVRRIVETGIDPLISKATGEKVPGQRLGISLTKRNLFNPEDKGSEAIDRFYNRLDDMEKKASGNNRGGEYDVDMGELKQMRKAADRLSNMRKQLKETGQDDEQRRIKRDMTYEIMPFVQMPKAFGGYKPSQRQ